jgi:hypothetical protein
MGKIGWLILGFVALNLLNIGVRWAIGAINTSIRVIIGISWPLKTAILVAICLYLLAWGRSKVA